MSSDAMVRATGIGKAYSLDSSPLRQLIAQFRPSGQKRDFWALKPLDLEIMRGDVVGIIGQNGSGKSTLLQILCGTLTPSCGNVQMNGRLAALLELGAGFNMNFTGWENIRLSASLYGLTADEVEMKLPAIEAFADIGDFINKPVKTYSSGMFVRLAFAVIANIDADILVIDEALAVGDVFFTQKCMRFLQEFAQTGTILFVSHDSSSVVSLCNRAILLEHGEMIASGDPKTVTEHYLKRQYDNKHPRPKKALESSDTENHVIELGQTNNDFGLGGVRILSVHVESEDGQAILQLHGKTKVRLKIGIQANQQTLHPLVGFSLKDRLGQVLFGGNSSDSGMELPALTAGKSLTITFESEFPGLTLGDYMISVAAGEGTAKEHVMHHWIHDAYALRSTCQSRAG